MATTASAVLLENGSATGDWVYFPGGNAVFSVVATFGGGTVALEVLGPDGATPILIDPAGNTNRYIRAINSLAYAPGQYRAVVAGGATGVHARLDRVPS
jgi:hypothetical protein